MRLVSAFVGLATASCFAAPPSGPASSPPVIFVSPAASPTIKASCDCTSYPFQPNPPCFGMCVGKFAESKNPNLLFVKGLDPGVAVSLKVLAASPASATFDYTKLTNKAELEVAAQKVVQDHELKFEPMKKLKYQK